MKTLFSLLIVILLLFGTWLLAQRPPPGPPQFFQTNAPAPAPGSTTNQTEPMLRALRQAMTNAPSGASNRPAATAPAPTQPAATSNRTGTVALPQSQPASPTPQPAGPRPTVPTQSVPAIPVPSPQPTVVSPPPTTPAPVPVPAGAVAPPGIPAVPPPAGAAAPAEADRIIPARTIQVNNMPLDQFMDLYSAVSGRTVLRPYALSGVQGLTLKAQTPLTTREAVYAMDAVLALNQISMIPVNDKFVKAVPSQIAFAEGAELTSLSPTNFSETEQFVTMPVKLKTVKPTDMAALLATFSKTQNGITPFDNNNTIVLRDQASNVKRMLDLIEKVDEEVEPDYKLEVIPIKYGKVVDLANTMSALISGTSTAGTTPTQPRAQRTGSRLGTSSTRSGRYGRGSTLQPQQTTPTPTPPGAAQSSFQNRLQQIVNRAAGGPEVELLQDARIVPDERSNTLLIFANKRDFEMISNIVAKVDVQLAQVLIEAVIMEVQLRDSDKLGVSFAQNPKRFGNDFSGAGGVNNGQNFLGSLTNFASSLPSGFGYFGNIRGDLDFAVNAIAENSTANVISRPRIQTSHGITGTFVFADELPFISGSYPNYYYGGIGGIGGGGYPNQSIVERLDVGITLSVTPFITPEGLVMMEIQQEANQKGGDVIIDGNPNPIVNKRTAEATLTVKDGQTIMMGGFITEHKSRSKSGVPILKDIPGLGALFRSHNNSNDRSELIVLMKATVLPSPERAAEVAAQEKADLPGIHKAEMEFHEEKLKLLRKVSKTGKGAEALQAPNDLKP